MVRRGQNKLEKVFSRSCKAHKNLWAMKLHNNPLAHQTTPADYIISWKETEGFHGDLDRIKLALVECKQVTCKEGKGRLAFKRLKQMHSMLSFHAFRTDFHESHFCIGFHEDGWEIGDIFMIPVHKMQEEIDKADKVSFNRNDMLTIFADYRLSYADKIIQLPKHWNNQSF